MKVIEEKYESPLTTEELYEQSKEDLRCHRQLAHDQAIFGERECSRVTIQAFFWGVLTGAIIVAAIEVTRNL